MMGLERILLDVLVAGVWQGSCIALVAAAGIAFAGPRINAATRCAILQAALVAVVVAPIATTVPLVAHRVTVEDSGRASAAITAQRSPVPIAAVADWRRVDVALSDRVVTSAIVIWIAGVFALGLRIAGAALALQRLVRRCAPFGDVEGVRLLIASDLGVPLALGFRRPAIVLPAALAADADAVGPIVDHELAHVRRRDAWANVAERAAQALLYFSPAVIVLLRAIALERESACDDWAVAKSRDLDSYTRSLAAFAVSSCGAKPIIACTASGFGRATVRRIERLEDARRNGATSLSPLTLGGSMFAFALIAATLQAVAPAIAFEPQTHIAALPAGSKACTDSLIRYVTGPIPDVKPDEPRSAIVLVRVTASGAATSTTVYKSSGDATFDRTVVRVAKRSTYAPEMHGCKAIPGTYEFKVRASP